MPDVAEVKPESTSSSSSTEPSPSKKRKTQNQQQRRVWTPEEDAIFVEMMEQVVSANLWQAIKTDGRLEYRGQPGIRAHLTAMMRKLKQAPSSESK